MPSKPIAEQMPAKPKAPAADELDPAVLDKVTGGLKPTGFKGGAGKTADPCEGGE